MLNQLYSAAYKFMMKHETDKSNQQPGNTKLIQFSYVSKFYYDLLRNISNINKKD